MILALLAMLAGATDPGVWIERADGSMEQLTRTSGVHVDGIVGSRLMVRYPESLPKRPIMVARQDTIVLVGADFVGLQLRPLCASEPRQFEAAPDQEYGPKMATPWWYVGVCFKSDTKYTLVRTKVKERLVDRVMQPIPTARIPARAIKWKGAAVLDDGGEALWVLAPVGGTAKSWFNE